MHNRLMSDVPTAFDARVLAVRGRTASCSRVSDGRDFTLHAGDLSRVFPGEIVRVRPAEKRRWGGVEHVTGEVVDVRLDARALGLKPLKLFPQGTWDPAEEYWGEEGEPIEDWALPIIARGRRPMIEMEQVCPGQDPHDIDSDPVLIAVELEEAGDRAAARRQLTELLEADLRCLDAHAHLGSFAFSRTPVKAIRHYEAGVRIAELSFAEGFDGVLAWGLIDNRPYLRCLHGFGLCLWRLGRFNEAGQVFERLLRLNPSDNQGVRFVLPEVRRGERWKA